MANRELLLVACLALGGCAARQTGPVVYRLISSGTKPVLIPPGVPDATASTRRFTFVTQAPQRTPCRETNDALLVEGRRRGSGGLLKVTVTRDALVTHPAPWLA